jgi:hypothetical protein
MKIIWQQGSGNPENPNNLATIRQWWTNLNGKEIIWQQRVISQTGEPEQLNWELQRFDESFIVNNPEIRGVTVYWSKSDAQERNSTPSKLILDGFGHYLYIFPQSQKELVIRVGLRSLSYQTVSMTNPQYSYNKTGENYILQIRDNIQQLEVKVSLSQENLKQLLRELTS